MKKAKTLKTVKEDQTLVEAVEALKHRRSMDMRAKLLEKELMEFAKMKNMDIKTQSEEQRDKNNVLLLAMAEMLAGDDYIEVLQHAALLHTKNKKRNGNTPTISSC